MTQLLPLMNPPLDTTSVLETWQGIIVFFLEFTVDLKELVSQASWA